MARALHRYGLVTQSTIAVGAVSRLRDWRRLRSTWRLGRDVAAGARDDSAHIVAGGLAFFATLSVFPALIALISSWALLAAPTNIEGWISEAFTAMPNAGQKVLSAQLERIIAVSPQSLGFGALFGIAAALFTASAGVAALMDAVNVAYDVPDARNLVRRRALALSWTVALVLGVLASVTLIAVIPHVLSAIALGGLLEALLDLARWPALALGFFTATAALYHLAPYRERDDGDQVAPGAALATLLWLGGSGLMSLYSGSLGTLNETYGALGGVVALMLWFYVSALAMLLGAELNAALERRHREAAE